MDPEACQEISHEVLGKLLHLVLPIMKKEAQLQQAF
jgi:hypothetical protein